MAKQEDGEKPDETTEPISYYTDLILDFLFVEKSEYLYYLSNIFGNNKLRYNSHTT